MAAVTDLAELLAGLSVARRPGRYTFVGPLEPGQLPTPGEPGLEALIQEDEGWTVVAALELVEAAGLAPSMVCAWLTLEVHSALEAVGLTAAVSAALTERGIAANVVAAYHHDHLLVPEDRADDAIAAIETLGRAHQR